MTQFINLNSIVLTAFYRETEIFIEFLKHKYNINTSRRSIANSGIVLLTEKPKDKDIISDINTIKKSGVILFIIYIKFSRKKSTIEMILKVHNSLEKEYKAYKKRKVKK